MRPGRPTTPVTLTDEERTTLERWSRRPKTAQALAQRARIVLGCAAGETNTAVARQVAGDEADGRQVARALSGQAAGRPAR